MKHRIYMIEMKDVDWDQYRTFIVIADSKEEAISMCGIKTEQECMYDNRYMDNIESIKTVGVSYRNQKKAVLIGLIEGDIHEKQI